MNIFLTEKQHRLIKETMALPIVENSPIKGIDNILLKKFQAERLQEVTECFSDNISEHSLIEIKNKLNRLLNACTKKEQKIRPQLEKICANVILEAFNIPQDTIYFECHLKDDIDPNHTFHVLPNTDEDYEYEDYEEIDNESNETEKRKFLLSLIYGAASSLAEGARKTYLSDIFDLDETLPHLYSKITKINDYLITNGNIKNTDKNHNQGGFAEVRLSNGEEQPSIVVEAVNFPILLFESLKAFLELIISNGLPDSKSLAKKVMGTADALENEPWFMKYGPSIWKRATNGLEDFDSKQVPSFLNTWACLPTSDFLYCIREALYKTRKGTEIVQQIAAKAEHDEKYSDFENDLIKKQDDKGIINDEYFSEEELIDEAYPENFND